MQNRKSIKFLLACVAALLVFHVSAQLPSNKPMKTIQYLGVAIPLPRAYRDIDDFKDDPNNLDEKASTQVAAVLAAAPFGPRFASANAMDDALFALTFPDYGMFFANQIGAKTNSTLEFAYVEIPKRSQNRYFAAERLPTGEFVVIADFVSASVPELTAVRRASNGSLEFGNGSNAAVLKRPPR